MFCLNRVVIVAVSFLCVCEIIIISNETINYKRTRPTTIQNVYKAVELKEWGDH